MSKWRRTAARRDYAPHPRPATNACGRVAYPTRAEARRDATGPRHNHRARPCDRCDLYHLYTPQEVLT